MMTTEKAKWTSSAGPIQTKKVVKALGELKRLASSHKEWSGVKPAPGMPDTAPDARDLSTLWSPFGPATFPAALEALDAIEKKYGLLITRENHGDIIAEATITAERLAKDIPVIDNRREYEAAKIMDTARANADLQRQLEDDKAKASHAAIMAKRPPWAAALIIAVYQKDDSDSMTDYFASHDERIVAIGWRKGQREDFKQLRRAAWNFKETAHLTSGPDAFEHRENYSMGAGNYLSAGGHHSTGWIVRSESLPLNLYKAIEDGIPEGGGVILQESDCKPSPSGYVGCTIQEHFHTKKEFQLLSGGAE